MKIEQRVLHHRILEYTPEIKLYDLAVFKSEPYGDDYDMNNGSYYTTVLGQIDSKTCSKNLDTLINEVQRMKREQAEKLKLRITCLKIDLESAEKQLEKMLSPIIRIEQWKDNELESKYNHEVLK